MVNSSLMIQSEQWWAAALCLHKLDAKIDCLQRPSLVWSLRKQSPGSRNAPSATALKKGLLLDNLKWLLCSPSSLARFHFGFSGHLSIWLNTHAVQLGVFAKKVKCHH